MQVAQLDELLAIRHCNFVVGQAGAGKSSSWKVLKEARSRLDPSNKIKVCHHVHSLLIVVRGVAGKCDIVFGSRRGRSNCFVSVVGLLPGVV